MKPRAVSRTAQILFSVTTMAACFASCLTAAERQVVSPGGGLKVIVPDNDGLNCRVEVNGKTVLTNSPLGLEFQDGAKLGPSAIIHKSANGRHDGQWENPFGNRRIVRDHWREVLLKLEERGTPVRRFGLIVRAYDDGVAFRYDLPGNSGLGGFVLTNELTEFPLCGRLPMLGGRGIALRGEPVFRNEVERHSERPAGPSVPQCSAIGARNARRLFRNRGIRCARLGGLVTCRDWDDRRESSARLPF